MYALRASRHTGLLPSVFRPLTSPATRSYAQPAVNKTTADGASDKGSKDAQPKILSRSPPKESEQSGDVQKHNREMDQRAEKPAEKVKQEDIEKDKVGKGFWSGEGQAEKK